MDRLIACARDVLANVGLVRMTWRLSSRSRIGHKGAGVVPVPLSGAITRHYKGKVDKAMYVPTKALPECVRSRLKKHGYNRQDIAVEAREESVLSSCGSKGNRAYVVAVNLATGQATETLGSWGGANMFNPRNSVDLDHKARAIPPGVVVILGQEGYQPYATIVVHPDTMAKVLPEPEPELPELERACLSIFDTYIPAARKEYFARAGIGSEIVDRLVESGHLARNKAGATRITTKGKNAA